MKPLGQKAYGSIPHISGSRLGPGDYHISEGQERIATQKPRDKHDLIIVQEKLDGSNVAVAKVDGKILALTRAGYLATSSPYQQHHYFAKWVEETAILFDTLLEERERVSGEWLALAHGTRYELKHEPFVPFDILTGTKRITYNNFEERVQQFGFVVPKLIHIGNSSLSLEDALQAIQISGHGALDEVEGVIWRVERKGAVDFLCKYVKHSKEDGKYFAEKTGNGDLWNCDVSKWMTRSELTERK